MKFARIHARVGATLLNPRVELSLRLCLAATLATPCAPAIAQDTYPSRPVKVIKKTSASANPAHHANHAPLLGRRGRPDEVASVVAWLAGPGGRYTTGQTLHVNGGTYLGG